MFVPPAVVRETTDSVERPNWLVERGLTTPPQPLVTHRSLGPGASEAISLALEVGVSWVILDERRGRRLAASLELDVIGTLGVLELAKRAGLLHPNRPEIEAMTSARFHMSAELMARTLTRLGED